MIICIQFFFSISNMVWNGGQINLPEIEVFGYRETEVRKKHQNHQQKQNELKILRTVAESDTHRSKEAIAFSPEIEHIPLGVVSFDQLRILLNVRKFSSENKTVMFYQIASKLIIPKRRLVKIISISFVYQTTPSVKMPK